ncbi:MAG: class I SAM-dependent methyltransferase [Candidatus Hodarchaeota archaeon]
MVQDINSDILNLIKSDNDKNFFKRIYSTKVSVYLGRLKAVGFDCMGKVLDAGCGFGQWSIALSKLNQEVCAIDIRKDRICMAKLMANKSKISNIKYYLSSIENLPFPNNSFNGIFSYSVLYMLDFYRALNEFHRVLRANGKLYFTTNGLGWYLHNLLEAHNPSQDYSPRDMAIEAIKNSLEFYRSGRLRKNQAVIMPSDVVIKHLKGLGFREILSSGEGKIQIRSSTSSPVPFYKEKYFGEEGVYEVLCIK